MDNLLNLPADAPAHTAWRCLWAMGIDMPHPPKEHTAAQWLTALALTDSLLKKIYLTAIEAQEGQTV
ncbi:hypothetical protein [Vreelandella glaciei]|uniref:hypothetical protein n=1 Tax=Vreelandella glaciei TaxID=186761 RepID=UPI0030EBB1A4|tara:strand:- start:1216 stop:1416 length:201 start_codon:yes stop_codon:yes gene_type:complete